MLYMIRCDPKHPLYGALRVPYVQVRVTRGVVVAHRNNYVPPRCRTSQYHRTFISLSVYLWNDLCDPVFDGVGFSGFKSRANVFLLAELLAPLFGSCCFPFLFFHSLGCYCLAGVFGLIGRESLSPSLALPTYFNNNNNNNN